MKSFVASLLSSAILAITTCSASYAAEDPSSLSLEKGSLFSADEIQYDQKNEVVTASGNVEIVQGERVLKADKVTYDVRQDSVIASGNIVLLEPTGEVVFAEKVELASELKTGAIRNIRVLFTDNSRLAAQSAVRVDENNIIMNNAVYSTCRLCETDRNAAPLWQAKSSKVVHDKSAKTITYKHAVLEFYGVPVLYTPYFSHPDPTVKRKSGFLAPSFVNSSDLGYGVTTPYYYVISEDKDFTFTPTVTTKEGVHLAGEYRQAFKQGDLELDGSVTYVDAQDNNGNDTGDQEFLSHLRGKGRFKLDSTWSWGFDAFVTSDETYLDRYDISNDDTLTSTAYLEGLRGRNYTSLSAYAFQGLQQGDDQGEIPFVPAWLEYSYVGEPDKYGARFSADVDGLTLFRTSGQDTARLSMSGAWHLPYTTPSGQVLELDASLRGDTYFTQDQLEDPFDPNSETSNEFTGRVIPSLSLKWSYPFVRHAGATRQLIEPVVEAVWSEALGSKNTPNEDSLSFEFDDTNLFGSNRYAGLDEVEEGPRLNYGVNFGFYGENGGHTTLLVGQRFHLDNETSFGDGTGLEDELSDYVARLEVQPNDYIKYIQRVRMDRNDLKLDRNEIDLRIGSQENWFGVGYLSLRDNLSAVELEKREEISLEGRVKMTEFWSTYGSYRRNLESNGGSIDAKVGIEYLDECFGFALEAKREFTRDRNAEPSTSVGFRIRLLPFN
ncbi:MAG: LPS assembly protein LptD [Sneathiella sp.]